MDWSGAGLGRADGLIAWSRYQLATGADQEAMRIAGDALAAAVDPDQPLARIAAMRLLGELETSSNLPDRAAAHLRDALELATACELPYEEALTRASLAELFRSKNEMASTDEEIHRARATAERLRAQPLLQRLAGIAPHKVEAIERNLVGLTPRELEVLRLVAQGMTDAAAGDALFISTRTVSQHLRSIYGKLDVSSRSAATRFAIEHELD